MAFVNALRGGSGVTGTNGWSDNDNEHIYDPVSFPAGNVNLAGAVIVAIESVSVNSPLGGITAASVGSDGYTRIYGGTPRINFNRNTGAGGVITSALSGFTWGGGLTGTFAWSTVPTMPTSISAVRTARNVALTLGGSSSDGGQGISGYKVQRSWSANGTSGWSAWEDEQTVVAGAYTYMGLTPGRYYKFRVYAQNVRGSSQARESSVLFVPAGGKRKVSGSFQNTTIARRRASGVWIDLSIAKRRASGVMVDLS